MSNIEDLFSRSIAEIERILSIKTVVGEPMKVDGHTLIPLVSVGFGFGAGTGEGSDPKRGAGTGGGTAGGGGVKPVALVVVNPDGVRVEPVRAPADSLLDKVVDVAGRFSGEKSKAG